MLVQNSIVIADFIRGIFNPLLVISVVCAILLFVVIMFGSCEQNKKAFWWVIPLGIELTFALWFFSTFSIQG